MTGNLVVDLAISLAGIMAMVAAAYLLGARGVARVTRETALDRLAFDEPDFRVGDFIAGVDGKAGAAVSADGEAVALVFAVGDGLVTRRLRKALVILGRDGDTVIFRLNEPSLHKVALRLADEAAAQHWLLRLSGDSVE